MEKATSFILQIIGNKVGLTADQVKSETEAGRIKGRYLMCKDCIATDCSSCHIAFKTTKITKQ